MNKVRKRILTYEILYRFWHSLSDYERQFAREQSRFKATLNEPRHYLQLFEYLDRQESPDEDKAMRHFKDTAIGKDWSFKKHQAFHKLVEFTVDAQSGSEAKMHFCLRANEMLQHKGFPEGHALFLDEALEIAQRIENVAAERKLLKYKKDIIIRHPQEYNVSAEISKIHAREDVLLAMEAQLHRLEQLSDMVDLKRSMFHFDPDLIERVKNDPAMGNVEKCLTARARILFYRIKALIHTQELQSQKVIDDLLALISTFETDTHLAEDSLITGIVISAIFDCSLQLISIKNFNDAKEVFQKIEKFNLGKVDPDRNTRLQTLFQIFLYKFQDSYSQLVSLADRVSKSICKSPASYSEQTKLIIYYSLAYRLFEFGDVSRSIYWTNKIMMEPEPKVRKDLKYFSRILFIVCQFERQDFDLVKKEIKSCISYYKRVGIWNDFYECLLTKLSSAAKAKTSEKRKAHFISLQQEFIELEKSNNYLRSISLFSYHKWINQWINKLK